MKVKSKDLKEKLERESKLETLSVRTKTYRQKLQERLEETDSELLQTQKTFEEISSKLNQKLKLIEEVEKEISNAELRLNGISVESTDASSILQAATQELNNAQTNFNVSSQRQSQGVSKLQAMRPELENLQSSYNNAYKQKSSAQSALQYASSNLSYSQTKYNNIKAEVDTGQATIPDNFIVKYTHKQIESSFSRYFLFKHKYWSDRDFNYDDLSAVPFSIQGNHTAYQIANTKLSVAQSNYNTSLKEQQSINREDFYYNETINYRNDNYIFKPLDWKGKPDRGSYTERRFSEASYNNACSKAASKVKYWSHKINEYSTEKQQFQKELQAKQNELQQTANWISSYSQSVSLAAQNLRAAELAESNAKRLLDQKNTENTWAQQEQSRLSQEVSKCKQILDQAMQKTVDSKKHFDNLTLEVGKLKKLIEEKVALENTAKKEIEKFSKQLDLYKQISDEHTKQKELLTKNLMQAEKLDELSAQQKHKAKIATEMTNADIKQQTQDSQKTVLEDIEDIEGEEINLIQGTPSHKTYLHSSTPQYKLSKTNNIEQATKLDTTSNIQPGIEAEAVSSSLSNLLDTSVSIVGETE